MPRSSKTSQQERMGEESGEEEQPQAETSSGAEAFSILSSASGGKRRRYRGKKRTSVSGRTWTKLEDVNAPRRPRSAYVLFLSSARAKYGTASKEGKSQSDINNALAAEWKALTDEERQVYHEKAKKERQEYEILMTEYKQTDAFKEFDEKVRMVKNHRRLCRKKGVVPDQEAEEAILGFRPDQPFASQRLDGEGEDFFDDFLPHSSGRKSSSKTASRRVTVGNDIPVFSDKFLEHNREREGLLRSLRRSCAAAREEGAAMQDVTQRLQATTLQIQDDTRRFREEEQRCEKQIAALCTTAAKHLHSLPGVTHDPLQMEQFLLHMGDIAATGKETATFKKVRDALQNVDFTKVRD